MKLVISAFPACGKSTISKNAPRYGLKWCQLTFNEETGQHDIEIPKTLGVPVFDSDSSLFDKAAFPQNYIAHIQSVLSQFDDVVIFVSSHEEVRKALHDAGIEFTLVYPQRELKEEYIQRYINRGNAQGFIDMMQARWNDFIDSCEADSTPHKVIMEESEYLGDNLAEVLETSGDETPEPQMGSAIDFEARLARLVARRSGAPDMTAAIVAVNADAGDNDVPDVVEANPPEPALLNEPETGETTPSRSELIEAKFDMQNDIETLDGVLTAYNEVGSDVAGMEQFTDGSELLTTAVADIKDRYGPDVEPTVAGLEGFFNDLKNAFKETFDELKGKPTKAQRVKIQKSFYQARQAIDEYSSPKWQSQQKFINVGKVKLQVPAVFKEINTAAGMAPIIDQFTKAVQNLENEHVRNVKARLSSGLKMYNKLKNNKTTDSKEMDQLLNDLGNVSPEALPDVKVADVKSLIDLSLSSVELPVLKKDDVSGMVKLLKDTLDSFSKLSDTNEDIALDTIDPSEFIESDFWDKAMTRPAARKVYSAVATEDVVHNLAMIEEGYGQQLMVIGKFIEMWILSSVK